MKIEELFIISSAWFIGMLGVGMEICFNHIYKNIKHTYYGFFSLIFFAVAIYFSLKYSGIIKGW